MRVDGAKATGDKLLNTFISHRVYLYKDVRVHPRMYVQINVRVPLMVLERGT